MPQHTFSNAKRTFEKLPQLPKPRRCCGPPNPTKLTMSAALNNYEVLGESRPKGMLASNSLVCIASELPVIRAQSDGMPPLASAPAVSRFGGILLSQCAAARVLLDKRRHKYERQ